MADKKRLRIKDRNGNVVSYDIAVEDITIDGEHKSLPQKLAEMAAAIVEASKSWTPTEESIAMANLSLAVQALLAKAGSAVQPADLSPINEAINSINRAIDAITGTTDTTDLIDSLNEVFDFLTGIENDETLSGKLLALQNAIDGKQDALTFDKAPTAGSDNPVESGGVYAALEEKADADKVYDKGTVDTKIDEVAAERAAIISLEEVDIIDQHDNNTVLAGVSARQMKLAYLAINAIYGKLNELISALAGMAFSGEKTQPLAALDWTGAITQYTLTPSLSACTASITRGDAGNNKLYEGLVVIRLTPSSPTYTFSNIIVTKSGTAMDIDRTDNQDGTVDISFVCSGDVTVTATAVDGFGITLYDSPHLSVSQTHSGDTYTAMLVPDDHFSLPDEIVVKKGVTTLVRNTDYTYNKATGKVVIYNVDADITIIAEVTEEAHVVLVMTGVGSNVVVKNGDDELVDGEHLYNSSALTIMLTPADGYKFAAAPSATIGGAQATMTGSSVYGSYSFVVAANVANGTTVAITASAIGLIPCSVSLPTVGNGFASVALTDLNGNAISSPVNEGTGVKIVLTPTYGFRITVSQATMQNGTMPQPANVNGVLTYTIGSVTGNIVITGASVEMVEHRVTNHFINMASTGDGYVEDGDDYTAVLSPTTGATSNGDLRVFVDGTPLEATDYTFDSATGALTIPAAKITGDVDVCATASTGKITVTVKAGMSTTVEFKQDQWKAAFYSDTIDASESAEDVTVVIDTVPKANGIPTVSLWTFGTPAAIKSLDFGGCKTHNSGTRSTFYGLSGAESISGLAYVEQPNNVTVSISNYFKNCSLLKGTLDLMTWRCDTMTGAGNVVDNCAADEIIMPYMPNRTQLNADLAGCKVKRVIFNKTGVITQFRQLFGGATGLEYVDMSRCPVHIGTGTYDWYIVENDTTNTFTLKIGVFEMDINPSGGLTHVGKLICTTMTPPGAAILGALSANVQIYVPNNAVEAYKTAWASKASNIHPVSEYTE